MKSYHFTSNELRFLRNANGVELFEYLHPNKEKIDFPNGTFFPVGVHSDYWNMYSYGKEIKVVYIKKGVPHQQEKNNTDDKIKLSEKSDSDNKNNDVNFRFKSSLSRTKSKVFEIASCNEFRYFCTFTLDKNKRDRYDLKAFSKTLSQFIRNRNRGRDEKIKYLNLPERHKDGAWHMHGLFLGLNDTDLTPFSLSDNIPQKIKKQIKNGEKVYNFPDYAEKFGFFTATEIKDNLAVSKYVTKYITKDLMSQILDSGEHMFYASQGLNRREVIVRNCFDNCPVEDWDFENEYVKIKTFRLS